eukprot:1992122-Pleurochrysis_carterae.AAC.12
MRGYVGRNTKRQLDIWRATELSSDHCVPSCRRPRIARSELRTSFCRAVGRGMQRKQYVIRLCLYRAWAELK